MVCTLIDNEYASLLFFQTFFLYFFCMLSEFAKVFARKVWCIQAAYLHNAACALSSPSWCFQLSSNLGRDFFRYLRYCGKKQIECGVAWQWWNSANLGLINWHVFNQSECRNCCLYIIIQKIMPQAKSGKYFQIWFSPWFWGKMVVFWACICKLSWTLFLPAWVQPL